MKFDEIVLTPEVKAEVLVRLEKSWSEKYDVPSQAPGFEGAVYATDGTAPALMPVV